MLSSSHKKSHSDKKQKKQLFLIDGYGFVFRAYHSLPPLTDKEGTPVGAVYGFTNMIMKLKNKVKPDNGHHMLVVFDSGRKTFRNDIYPEYKANRPPAPEDLIPQFPLVRDAAEALGLPISSSDGYEADDIIATYARIAKKQGMQVTIVSSDKDLMQLIDEDIEMYDAMKDKRISSKEVLEKFGVPPEKLLDAMALIGDSSDNVPGVPGIGPKTAAELINKFDSLEELLARADEIPQEKRRQSIKENAEKARLSRKLIELCNEVPVDEDIEKLSVRDEHPEELLKFLRHHGFKSLISRIEQKHGIKPEEIKDDPKTEKPHTHRKVKKHYRKIEKPEDLKEWLDEAVLSGKLAIDMDDGHIILANMPGNACLVPMWHEKEKLQQSSFDFGESSGKEEKINKEIFALLQPILSDDSVLKIGHDIKALMHLLETVITPADDIMLMSYLLDGSKQKKNLNELAEQHLGESIGDEVCASADAMLSLNEIFRRRLFLERMLTVYETLERPLIPVLYHMEKSGVKVDSKTLESLSDDFSKGMAKLEKEIHNLAGEEFNVASPKQLGEVLFDRLKIEGGKKSKSGAYSTGADILEKLAAEGHDIAARILDWRLIAKLKNTYTDSLLNQINKKTGRIHTTFAMTVTSTGRLSSINPNLQNIPIRSEEGRKIRSAFIAEKGNMLISADYSQIELRLLAHLANIEHLKDAFHKGEDIHALTASQVFGIPIDKVDANTRRAAKTINFGIIYGQSAFGLANQLGIGRKEAASYIEAYFRQYPGIKQYMEETKEVARRNGYVTTLYGRKCFVPDIKDKNPARRNFAERAAINAPLQGTAADLIKKAMINLEHEIKHKKLAAKIILQVHDELLVEVPEKETKEATQIVKKAMEDVIKLSIPVTAEAKTGKNWGEIH